MAWLWMFGVAFLMGVCVTAAEAVAARRAGPVQDARDAAAEYLRGLAPPGCPTLAEAAVLARTNPRADTERVTAAIELLDLDLTGDH